MDKNIATTRMEIYIDEEYWITKWPGERKDDIEDSPEDISFLTLLLQLVSPGAERASDEAEKYFDDF